MTVSLRLLNSDKSSVFTTQSFGNILAGANSTNKLVFVDSYGDATASGVEFGSIAVVGNDGVNYAMQCSATAFNSSGTSLTNVVSGTGGTIPSNTSLKYKLSVIDSDSWESDIISSDITTASLSGTNTNAVHLSWSAVSGAATYGVYLSLDDGATYKKVTTTALFAYTDTSGTATATDPQASGSTAYRPSTFAATAVNCGNLASGTKFPVFFDVQIPSGTTSTGNPRQYNLYLSYLTA